MLYELMTKFEKLRLPPIEYLKKRYEIDPLTGLGRYKIDIPNNGIKKGDLVQGFLKRANVDFYKYVHIDGQQYAWHRICYAIYHGKDPFPFDVDHRNQRKLDCSKKNLIRKTTAENNKNKPVYKNNKLGIKGVSKTTEGKYRAIIYKDKKSINCGTFATIKEAIQAQKQKKLVFFPHLKLNLENNA